MKDRSQLLCLTIMARQSEKGIERVLRSFGFGKKHPLADVAIVGVDDRTTDKTALVAKRLGARVYPFHFEDDFSKVRSWLFDLARKETRCRWVMWVDSDDVLCGREALLPNLMAAERDRPQLVGFQLAYYYARDAETNHWSVYHDRLRILRSDVPATWVNRVHEVLMIPGVTMEGVVPDVNGRPGVVAGCPEVWIEHVRDFREQPLDPDRNLRLIGLQLKDDEQAGRPVNASNLYHLGMEAMARSQWENAIQCFERYVKISGFREEIYDALVEIGTAHRRIVADRKTKGLVVVPWLQRASSAYLRAIELEDGWPDAWYGLASVKYLSGQAESALRFIDRAKALGRVTMPPVVGVQPLRITLDALITELHCHSLLGDVAKGLEVSERAIQEWPHQPDVKLLRDEFVDWDRRQREGLGLISLAEQLPDDARARLWTSVPEALRAAASVREAFMPAVIAQRNGSQERVVIVCPEALEDWGPPKIDEGGIGGSETAVVHVARGLAKRGYQVEVYNQAGVYEGEHDGVLYANLARWNAQKPALLTVLSREPRFSLHRSEIASRELWFWAHDLHYGDDLTAESAVAFDRIMPVSEWHAKYLRRCYPFLRRARVTATRNGIDLSRFYDGGASRADETKRKRRKCVYLSSPERGLATLMDLWPRIRGTFEDAELHVFYGWNTWDAIALKSRNANMFHEKEWFMRRFPNRGAIWHGRVGQAELARELMTADLWLYPTAFLEVSCISAMECMAAGCVGVATACGALPETLGDRGVLLPEGWPGNRTYQDMFLNTVISLMADRAHIERRRAELKRELPEVPGLTKFETFDEMLKALPYDDVVLSRRAKGIEHTRSLSWDGVVEQWIGWIASIELSKTGVAEAVA